MTIQRSKLHRYHTYYAFNVFTLIGTLLTNIMGLPKTITMIYILFLLMAETRGLMKPIVQDFIDLFGS